MLHPAHHFAADCFHLASGFIPLALLSSIGGPAVLVSIFNIIVVAALRYADMRQRSKERLELAKLRAEVEISTSARRGVR